MSILLRSLNPFSFNGQCCEWPLWGPRLPFFLYALPMKSFCQNLPPPLIFGTFRKFIVPSVQCATRLDENGCHPLFLSSLFLRSQRTRLNHVGVWRRCLLPHNITHLCDPWQIKKSESRAMRSTLCVGMATFCCRLQSWEGQHTLGGVYCFCSALRRFAFHEIIKFSVWRMRTIS